MNVVPRCFSSTRLKNLHHPRQLHNVRLIVEPPLERIHQPVVVLIHRLIHPDRIRHMQTHRHLQLSGLVPHRIHPRIIRMHPRRLQLSRLQPFALVVNLPDPPSAASMTPLQLLHCRCRKSSRLVSPKIQPAPQLKPLRELGILLRYLIELRANRHGEDHCLFHTDLIHRPHPLLNLRSRLRIRMRMHIDNRELCLIHVRDRNLVDRSRPIILQQNAVRRSRRGSRLRTGHTTRRAPSSPPPQTPQQTIPRQFPPSDPAFKNERRFMDISSNQFHRKGMSKPNRNKAQAKKAK